MNRRNIILTVLVLIPFLCWGADEGLAQPTPKKGGTINVGLNTDVTAVDPHIPTADVVALVFTTSSSRSSPTVTISSWFRSWPSGGKAARTTNNFTFHLRKGRLFHNGREMVADDVKYSIERFMKVNPRRDLLKNVRAHRGSSTNTPFACT